MTFPTFSLADLDLFQRMGPPRHRLSCCHGTKAVIVTCLDNLALKEPDAAAGAANTRMRSDGAGGRGKGEWMSVWKKRIPQHRSG